MTRTHLLLPTIALAVGLAVSGCGGKDDSGAKADPSASPTLSITTADFTTQANAICAAGNTDIQTAAGALGDSPTQEQMDAFASDTLVPNIQGQHDGIEELGAPDGSEADVTAMLDSLQSGIDAVTADPSIISGDTDPFGEANDLAAGLGLTDCTG
ncbi:MAG: hypothetical protein JWN22_2987 [Nocardioides sp.]|jgi:hypothetical protein|nr:hypothetical protein [Nocardioides sp.]